MARSLCVELKYKGKPFIVRYITCDEGLIGNYKLCVCSILFVNGLFKVWSVTKVWSIFINPYTLCI